jgi:hypothetical protein
MKKLITVSVSIALALALGSRAANAASLSTPALQRDGVHRLVCVVSNVGSKPITVSDAGIVDELTGSFAGSSGYGVGSLPGCNQAVLQPGTGCSSDVSTNGNNPRVGHCVVTFAGSKKSVRAALWVVDSAFPYNLVGPVAPAN